ncbi:NADH-ubiquinone oxidoreductase [Streptomyces sp. XY58]|nr:NADH-ubiquinone oxidoreductase [Streptomyces sp. XY58]KOV13057.1 NADH-ubiquinone oxidoreductase [Streptomyces sp. XY37]KOV56750.1 NADH-ubiquinone oxidoreductase [Streptomyces sp. MMG1064]
MPQQRAEGAGPFTTRLTWQRPEGDTVVWESRPARRRGTLAVRSPGETAARTTTADAETLGRLRRLNTIASAAFFVGGALFALGAAVAQFGWGDTAESAAIYFAGGLFFNTGGYVSLLQVLNGPRHTPEGGGRLVTARWKWWGYEPMRLDWLSTFVLFVGTLVFGVNLLDSFLQGLTAQQTNRLIWTPDVIGCLLFLLSGHLAFVEICHRPWPRLRSRSLGWWIVAVNQFGSVLFMVSALAAFTRPATGSLVNSGIANWGTLCGALCFSLGGILQAFERP